MPALLAFAYSVGTGDSNVGGPTLPGITIPTATRRAAIDQVPSIVSAAAIGIRDASRFMALRQCLKPCGKTGWHLDITSLQRFHPRQIALQRARQVDRRPPDMQQAFVEAGRGHVFTLFVAANNSRRPRMPDFTSKRYKV